MNPKEKLYSRREMFPVLARWSLATLALLTTGGELIRLLGEEVLEPRKELVIMTELKKVLSDPIFQEPFLFGVQLLQPASKTISLVIWSEAFVRNITDLDATVSSEAYKTAEFTGFIGGKYIPKSRLLTGRFETALLRLSADVEHDLTHNDLAGKESRMILEPYQVAVEKLIESDAQATVLYHEFKSQGKLMIQQALRDNETSYAGEVTDFNISFPKVRISISSQYHQTEYSWMTSFWKADNGVFSMNIGVGGIPHIGIYLPELQFYDFPEDEQQELEKKWNSLRVYLEKKITERLSLALNN